MKLEANLDATTIRGCCAVRGRMPARLRLALPTESLTGSALRVRPDCVLDVFLRQEE